MASMKVFRDYYFDNVKDLVFYERKTIGGKTYVILYSHDRIDETSEFVRTFTEYLPFYAGSSDVLEVIDVVTGIQNGLINASKVHGKSSMNVKRPYKRNGIYGELFLDFYERIVNDRKLFITYSARKAYSNNEEQKGYDHLGFMINDDSSIELVIGEAKYVEYASTAKDDLKKDISVTATTSGKSHLSKDYFNSFTDFAVRKNAFFSDSDKNSIKSFFTELNRVVVNGTMTPLDFFIRHNTKIRIVLFAVFKSTKDEPTSFVAYYDELYEEARNSLRLLGISNYAIEVVFVPTEKESTDIKEKIDEFYR